MKFVACLPALALGPVTGPLLALALLSFQARRPWLGIACVAGVAGFWIAAPAALGAELSFLRGR